MGCWSRMPLSSGKGAAYVAWHGSEAPIRVYGNRAEEEEYFGSKKLHCAGKSLDEKYSNLTTIALEGTTEDKVSGYLYIEDICNIL
jgi:hypothetical protein